MRRMSMSGGFQPGIRGGTSLLPTRAHTRDPRLEPSTVISYPWGDTRTGPIGLATSLDLVCQRLSPARALCSVPVPFPPNVCHPQQLTLFEQETLDKLPRFQHPHRSTGMMFTAVRLGADTALACISGVSPCSRLLDHTCHPWPLGIHKWTKHSRQSAMYISWSFTNLLLQGTAALPMAVGHIHVFSVRNATGPPTRPAQEDLSKHFRTHCSEFPRGPPKTRCTESHRTSA
ncbi:hypothetical protein VTN02DRAFT_274 [Thermoascus thermophilus]